MAGIFVSFRQPHDLIHIIIEKRYSTDDDSARAAVDHGCK
jgi:hypothetical protein